MEYTYSFNIFHTHNKNFWQSIYNGEITLKEANDDQTNLLVEIMNFKKKTKPHENHNPEKKQEKKDILKNLYAVFEGSERVLHAFESKKFLIKSKGICVLNFDLTKLKILSPKQMLQRLPIALAQLKAGNNSENLLNEIRKSFYFLYQSKKNSKKVCNNVIKSM